MAWSRIGRDERCRTDGAPAPPYKGPGDFMPKPDLRQGSPLFIDAFAGFASMLRVWLQSDQPVVVLQTLSHRQSRRRHTGCGSKLPAFCAAASRAMSGELRIRSAWAP